MDSTSVVLAGDHSLSATTAARGHTRESTVSSVTYSLHMHASPPRMCAVSALVSWPASPLRGSTW